MVTIRRQTDADIDEVAALHVRTWQVAYEGLVPAGYLAGLSAAGFAGRHRELAHLTNLVAVDDGLIVGFSIAGPHRGDDSYGEIYAFYVEPGRWRSGIGRALADATERELAVTYPAVRLWVLEENQPARPFYERLGMRADGERDVWTPPGGHGVGLTRVRYGKKL